MTRRLGLAGLGLATLLPMLAGSMANLVLPALGQDFGVPFASLQWVLVTYLLGITSLTVVAGRLGDRLGRRRLLLWGTGVFALASCCAPWPFHRLAHCRSHPARGGCGLHAGALAGHGGRLVPPARRGWSMGLLGTLSACGTALGPSFGGLLIGGFGWQAPFLLLLPPGVAGAGVCLARPAPG
ncbi:MFS transporter [Aeromonas hydrophila]|uniref:MFS transporter n=1 Tax=Aeromonas hydrophila TaxID=644 RepID=A0A926FLZ3_AERHY|nr:MFS transporter [Aeromonas hydrophila]